MRLHRILWCTSRAVLRFTQTRVFPRKSAFQPLGVQRASPTIPCHADPAALVPAGRSEAAVLGRDDRRCGQTYNDRVLNLLQSLGIATSEPAGPNPDSLSRLQLLLWAGVSALVLVFGLVVLLTVVRMVRRRYFRKVNPRPVAAPTPWQEAGQRARPVEGGQLIEEATPDDDPEGYEQQRRARLEDDPNDDTGPFPDEDEDDDADHWRPDPDDDRR